MNWTHIGNIACLCSILQVNNSEYREINSIFNTETIVCLSGKFVQYYYSGQGNKSNSFEFDPNFLKVVMNVSVGKFHALELLEEGI